MCGPKKYFTHAGTEILNINLRARQTKPQRAGSIVRGLLLRSHARVPRTPPEQNAHKNKPNPSNAKRPSTLRRFFLQDTKRGAPFNVQPSRS